MRGSELLLLTQIRLIVLGILLNVARRGLIEGDGRFLVGVLRLEGVLLLLLRLGVEVWVEESGRRETLVLARRLVWRR